MLETSARLLRLLSLLQAPRGRTGAELAERLEVSPRTVRKDIERLRLLGYPVRATRGSAGGYRLEAGTAMPPLLLDDEEAVAVAMGLRTAAGGTIAGIEETSLRALAKLEQVMPARLRRQVNALQTYTVPVTSPGPTVDASVLMVITAACRDRELLRFDYVSHSGTAGPRTVEPYRLVNWGRRWYLVAWDTFREDWRTFRVDRMTPRAPAGPRFAPRPLPGDLTAHVTRGVAAAPWNHRARVVVHAPAAEIAERVPLTAGYIEPLSDHTCVLETGAPDLDTLTVYLGMLRADFTVTSPPELVAHLEALSARYARSIRPDSSS